MKTSLGPNLKQDAAGLASDEGRASNNCGESVFSATTLGPFTATGPMNRGTTNQLMGLGTEAP